MSRLRQIAQNGFLSLFKGLLDCHTQDAVSALLRRASSRRLAASVAKLTKAYKAPKGASKNRLLMPGPPRGGSPWRQGWRQEASREGVTASFFTELTSTGERRFRVLRSSSKSPRKAWLSLTLCLFASLGSAERGNGESPNTSCASCGLLVPPWSATHILTEDGYALPYRSWYPRQAEPEAIILGLHGLNDYSAGLHKLAEYLADQHGIATYAYDQRGFGATVEQNEWAGNERLISDAQFVARLLAERYPDKPLYVAGHSMGGGIAIRLAVERDPEHLDGLILIAPAVWGRSIMPWYQRTGLWLATHLTPQLKLSSAWVDVEPTDNPEQLDRWRTDPLIQRQVPARSLARITELMGKALQASGRLHLPSLILYGERDGIVPAEPICAMLSRLPEPPPGDWRFALYPQGHHMLTRDLHRQVVLEDIGAWLSAQVGGKQETALPSNLDKTRQQAIQALCK